MNPPPAQAATAGVAPLQSPVKGAAARLASLSPVGPPLTAGLRFARWQGRVARDAQPCTGAGHFPGGPRSAGGVCPPGAWLAARAQRDARSGSIRAAGSPAHAAAQPLDQLRHRQLRPVCRFHRTLSPCKGPAQWLNPWPESPTIIHGGPEFFYRRDAEHTERYRRRLIRQLERLGHKVSLEPLPEAA